MKEIHSVIAYFAVISLFASVVNSIWGYFLGVKFRKKDRLLGLFSLIFIHVQLIVGMVLYFVSPVYKSVKIVGMAAIMKDPQTRLLVVEHPVAMILVAALVTIGWSQHKKQSLSRQKYKKFVIFYSTALALLLYMIPWRQWI